jgi:hypothetical protein
MLQMSKDSMLVLALFFAMALAATANAPSPSGVDTADCQDGKPTGENLGDKAAFTVYRERPAVQNGPIDANGERSVALEATRGASAQIAAGIKEKSTANRTVRSLCGRRRSYQHTSYRADRHTVDGRLPYTGPPADLMSKIAIAGGLVLTGGLFWWYGAIWPRRTPNGPIAIRRSPYGRRRHLGLSPDARRTPLCPPDRRPPLRPSGRRGGQASVMPVRARPPADSRTAAATAPATSGWNTLGTM